MGCLVPLAIFVGCSATGGEPAETSEANVGKFPRLDFCGDDVDEDGDGTPRVCEEKSTVDVQTETVVVKGDHLGQAWLDRPEVIFRSGARGSLVIRNDTPHILTFSAQQTTIPGGTIAPRKSVTIPVFFPDVLALSIGKWMKAPLRLPLAMAASSPVAPPIEARLEGNAVLSSDGKFHKAVVVFTPHRDASCSSWKGEDGPFIKGESPDELMGSVNACVGRESCAIREAIVDVYIDDALFVRYLPQACQLNPRPGQVAPELRETGFWWDNGKVAIRAGSAARPERLRLAGDPVGGLEGEISYSYRLTSMKFVAPRN